MRNHAGSHGTKGAFVTALVVLGFTGFLFTGSASTANALEMMKAPSPIPRPTGEVIQPRYGVDLYVSSVSSSTSGAILGGQITLTDTTNNLGTFSAGTPSYTKYYLSTDRVAGGDVYLGERQVPALGPGDSNTGQKIATIPSTMPIGLYYVIACADNTGLIKEVFEGNNCRSSATQISVGKMDLIVSSLSAPGIVGYGKSFEVSDVTRNAGSVATPVTSYTKYLLSVTMTLNAMSAATQLGEHAVPANLGVGAYSTGTIQATPHVPMGSYFLAACADYTNQILETNEGNNCYFSPIKIVLAGPDLGIDYAAISSPATRNVLPGGQIQVTAATSNGGSSSTQAVTYTKYYLNRLPAPAYPGQVTGTTYLGERAVPALASGEVNAGTIPVTIPVNTVPGKYFVVACADNTGLVPETSETNNCNFSNPTMALTVGGPNLAIGNVASTLTVGLVGGQIQVTETTSNIGTGPAQIVTYTGYYLKQSYSNFGTERGTGTYIGERAVPALGSGASNAGTVSVTIPANTTPGTYVLAACADRTGLVQETDENNCKDSNRMIVVQLE